MYRTQDCQMTIEDFILPFEGELKADNRWVKMAEIIRWLKSNKNTQSSYKTKSVK